MLQNTFQTSLNIQIQSDLEGYAYDGKLTRFFSKITFVFLKNKTRFSKMNQIVRQVLGLGPQNLRTNGIRIPDIS